ncbi:CD151 antigen-like [Sycon ciliatum]|uniref:CD151 antigen-like n=1 Tax=Sycon ciliatum TaxID=27933 RepID=UPI0031F61ECF
MAYRVQSNNSFTLHVAELLETGSQDLGSRSDEGALLLPSLERKDSPGYAVTSSAWDKSTSRSNCTASLGKQGSKETFVTCSSSSSSCGGSSSSSSTDKPLTSDQHDCKEDVEKKLKFCQAQVYITTVLVWVFGVTSLSVGVWLRLFAMKDVTIIVSNIDLTLRILLGMGFSVATLALLGFATILWQKRLLVVIHTVVMSLSLILSLFLVYKSLVPVAQHGVETYYLAAMETYDTKVHVHNAIDHVQSNFECCGAVSPSDWEDVSSNSTHQLDVEAFPASCCVETSSIINSHPPRHRCTATGGTSHADKHADDGTLHYTKGCSSQLRHYIKRYFILISFQALLISVCLVWHILVLERYSSLLHRRHEVKISTCTLPSPQAV